MTEERVQWEAGIIELPLCSIDLSKYFLSLFANDLLLYAKKYFEATAAKFSNVLNFLNPFTSTQ